MWHRLGCPADTPLETTRGFNFGNSLHNSQVGGDPKTPVFRSQAGQITFFHLLRPAATPATTASTRTGTFGMSGRTWATCWTSRSRPSRSSRA